MDDRCEEKGWIRERLREIEREMDRQLRGKAFREFIMMLGDFENAEELKEAYEDRQAVYERMEQLRVEQDGWGRPQKKLVLADPSMPYPSHRIRRVARSKLRQKSREKARAPPKKRGHQ